MRKLVSVLALVMSSGAVADSDYFIRWVVEPGLTVDVKHLEFDVEVLRKYITLNGAIIDTAGNGHNSATGTCFELGVGGISCYFNAAYRVFEISTDANLTGTIKERDSNGNLLGSALIRTESIQ